MQNFDILFVVSPNKVYEKQLNCQWFEKLYPSRMPWWRHKMETFSTLLAICAGNSPVAGEFPAQRPVTLSFDVFIDLRLNKRLIKQSWGWWFETNRAHYDVTVMHANWYARCFLWIVYHISQFTVFHYHYYARLIAGTEHIWMYVEYLVEVCQTCC